MTANMIPAGQFAKMEYSPVTTKKKMVDAYPRLRAIMPKKEVDDRVMRYIAFMYDSGSPLPTSYADLIKRKEFAADLAGFDLEADAKVLEGLFDFTDDTFVDLVANFLRIQQNRLFTLIVSQEQVFYEYEKRLFVPVTAGESDRDKDVLTAASLKSRLMDDMDNIHNRLTNYYRQLTGDDNGLEDKLMKRQRVTPESIASSK